MVGKTGSGVERMEGRRESDKAKIGRPTNAERQKREGRGALDKFIQEDKDGKTGQSKGVGREETGKITEPGGKSEKSTVEVMDMLGMLMAEVKSGKEEVRKAREEAKEEIREIRKLIESKDEEWKTERRGLEKRIERIEQNLGQKEREGERETRWEGELRQRVEELSSRVEKGMGAGVEKEKEEVVEIKRRVELQDRRERRNNLTIRGVEREGIRGKEGVERLFTEKLEVQCKIDWVKESGREGRRMVVARCSSWEEKLQVLKNKYKLKGTDIFIEQDLTWEEREMQRKIVRMAVEERKKGRVVKVGYQKIGVDGEWFDWKVWEGRMREGQQNF